MKVQLNIQDYEYPDNDITIIAEVNGNGEGRLRAFTGWKRGSKSLLDIEGKDAIDLASNIAEVQKLFLALAKYEEAKGENQD